MNGKIWTQRSEKKWTKPSMLKLNNTTLIQKHGDKNITSRLKKEARARLGMKKQRNLKAGKRIRRKRKKKKSRRRQRKKTRVMLKSRRTQKLNLAVNDSIHTSSFINTFELTSLVNSKLQPQQIPFNSKMQRLKRHSEKYQLQYKDDNDDVAQDNEIQPKQKEEKLQLRDTKPIKNKFKERLALIKQYEAKTQDNHSDGDESQTKEENNYEQTEDKQVKYLNKFADDEGLDSTQINKQQVKKPKTKEIKIHNKLFADYQFSETDIQEKIYSGEDIVVERRQKKEVSHLMNKVNKKADTFKNRLDFKDLGKDHMYKQNMKQKLKSIGQFEEVNLVVQVPKVLRGRNSHVDTALFLKKHSRDALSSQSQTESQNQQDTTVPKDRKSYYQELNKQLKLKKAQSFTEKQMKQCFKKSFLDQNDYIQDLSSRRNEQSKTMNSNYNQQTNRAGHKQERIKKTVSQEIIDSKYLIGDGNTTTHQEQINKQSNQQKIIIVKSEQQISNNHGQVCDHHLNQQHIDKNTVSVQQSVKQTKEEKVETKLIKKNKQTNKKKPSSFSIHQYLDVEAESSDDDNHKHKKQRNKDQEEEDNDSDISSLIDDNEESLSLGEINNIHGKYVIDMIEAEERRYQEMRKKIQKQYLEEQARKERMIKASKKNQLKQETICSISNPVPLSNQTQNSNTSNKTAERMKNQQKLRELQIQLGVVRQTKDIGKNCVAHVTERLKGTLQKIQKFERQDFEKPNRLGLHNILIKKPDKRMSVPKPAKK